MDAESSRFIKWVQKRYKRPEALQEDIAEAIYKCDQFFCSPDEKILSALTKKLERGAEEHGAPIYTQAQVKKEMELEYIDILGWYLVGEFNRKKVLH